MRTCVRCKCYIPNARLEILPDTQTCVGCSGVQKYVDYEMQFEKTFLKPLRATRTCVTNGDLSSG